MRKSRRFTLLQSRRLGTTLRHYVIRELAFPTTIALVGLTVLVLTKDLLGFSDLVINHGFGAMEVAWIAFYEAVPLAARTLPFAVLVGTLVGLGRLRADLEILAVEAAGVSSRQLLGPVLSFATMLAIVGLFLTLYAAPRASRSFEASLQQMTYKNPGILLRPGIVHGFSGSKIIAREVSARGDQLRGVLLWIPDRGQTFFAGQTIFAERGVLESLSNGASQLILYDGITLLSPRDGGGETRFATFTITLQANPAPKQRYEALLAKSSVEQVAAFAWAGEADARLARQAQIEFHHRFSYPTACIMFSLLAASLALSSRRLSRAVGGVVGLFVTVIYYGLLQLGDGLAYAGVVNVGLGVWLPNLVVSILAVGLFWLKQWWFGRRRETRHQEDTGQTSDCSEVRLPRFHGYLLPRYVAQHYLQMLLLSFGLLVVGYLLVDVLERFHRFARYQAELLEIIRFYGARTPLLASRMIPMALLLATALTVSLLSTHRELIAMRACGISAMRALTPILLIAGSVMPGYFLLNEFVVPRTNALADQIQETDIKDRQTETSLRRMIIWYRAGTHVYEAAQLDPTLGEAQNISIYELGANGLPVSRTDAPQARHIGDGVWKLTDPVRIEISDQGLRETPAHLLAQLGEAPNETVDTMHLGARQLARVITDTEASGYDATAYRVDLHVKLAAPLACLLLPAVTLLFAIGGPPFPGPALTILTSSVLGVGYMLLTGVCASLGYGGFLSPSIAGWGSAAILVGLASAVALRSRG